MTRAADAETGRYPAASFIDPVSLMQIESLELRARAVMDGFFAGLHRSPSHGFSVEFTEYREYVAGDDLRYLDWRLFARSDRYYIKRFEEETNLRCYLLVDNSQSMNFGSLGYSKADYAKTLAGTIAYFLHQQRDTVGLFRFSESLDEVIPPRYRPGHLRQILIGLEKQPEGKSTGLVPVLEQVSSHVRRRSLVILISDLLVPLEEFDLQLSYLRASGCDVALFQIMDPAEVEFPFSEATLFIDSESGREIYVDPEIARHEYRMRFQSHLKSITESCERLGVHLNQVVINTPLEEVLLDFLKTRLQVMQSRHRA